MKRYIFLFFAVVALLFTCTFSVFAHSGRTDENGGHYDSSTGEYHYHHGWPPHDHIDGECPYDFEDNVDHGRDNSSKSNSKKDNTPNAPLWLQYVVGICFLLPMPMGGLFVFRESFREYKQQPTQKNLHNLYFFSFLCFCCIAGFVITLICIFA